jgi:hypothetical protein
MSPGPEIKKPKPILTPLVKNNILKNNGIEKSTFAKSPASKIRTLQCLTSFCQLELFMF